MLRPPQDTMVCNPWGRQQLEMGRDREGNIVGHIIVAPPIINRDVSQGDSVLYLWRRVNRPPSPSHPPMGKELPHGFCHIVLHLSYHLPLGIEPQVKELLPDLVQEEVVASACIEKMPE